MREVAEALDDGYKNKVLPTRPGIVNLQCDIDHPTQSMADLLHLKQQFGSLKNLKGKKIAMTWAYSPSYGKPIFFYDKLSAGAKSYLELAQLITNGEKNNHG